jgi:acyl carrier protein
MEMEKLIERIAFEFDLNKGVLQPNTSFRDLEEWSSMHALILIALVDTEYNVTINGEDLKAISTVQDLYNLVKSRQ